VEGDAVAPKSHAYVGVVPVIPVVLSVKVTLNPLQTAVISALKFATGCAMPFAEINMRKLTKSNNPDSLFL
jgi:hypothetical protein